MEIDQGPVRHRGRRATDGDDRARPASIPAADPRIIPCGGQRRENVLLLVLVLIAVLTAVAVLIPAVLS